MIYLKYERILIFIKKEINPQEPHNFELFKLTFNFLVFNLRIQLN
jgi:hypothetical protein